MTRVSISEARRRLPQLVRQVSQDRGSVVQITVRDEVIAELRAALAAPEPEPGAAVRALLELMHKLRSVVGGAGTSRVTSRNTCTAARPEAPIVARPH